MEHIRYSGWMAVWAFVLGSTGAYAECALPLNGQNEYEVATYAQLKQVGVGDCSMDADYRLVSDIDASASQTENCAEGGDCAGFVPIGHAASLSVPAGFLGAFHGGGHAILGLHIYLPKVGYVGLFAQLYEGSVVDSLELRGAVVSGDVKVGGLAGALQRGKVSGCLVEAKVNADSDVGGVLGWLDRGSVEHVQATVDVEGAGSGVGGLVGSAQGTIGYANVQGRVVGKSNVGGLLGSLDGVLQHSRAAVETQGEVAVGGLVGQVYSGQVLWGAAQGAVQGLQNIGGLIGYSFGDVDSSTATGVVRGNSNVGGLVGVNSNGAIAASLAQGDVQADSVHAGGLVGYSIEGSITRCAATGRVKGARHVGGLVGNGMMLDVTYSYATGEVSGGAWVGGLLGEGSFGAMLYCYATASVSGDTVGGLIGRDLTRSVDNSYAAVRGAGGTDAGGFFGVEFSSSADASYWDKELFAATSDLHEEQGRTGAQMRQQATFSGWDFAQIWGIAEGKSTPWLRGMDNAPFARNDSLRCAVRCDLSRLLLNDYDGETETEKLLVRVLDSGAASVEGNVLTLPASVAEGQTAYLRYRVGEQRAMDTLWGNVAEAWLVRDDAIAEPTLSLAGLGNGSDIRIRGTEAGLRVQGLRGTLELYTPAGQLCQRLEIIQDGHYALPHLSGIYLVRGARYQGLVRIEP